MKKITLALAFLLTMVMSGYGQVSYQYGWEPAGMGGWTGVGFARTTITPCVETATVRANTYSSSNSITSPSLGMSNGGVVTFNFDYKLLNWSANTVGTPANQVEIIAQWSNSATGPWFPIGAIGEANHTVSNECATKTFTFSPTPGNLFVKLINNSVNGADVYCYFDNINITQGAAPSCVSPSGLAASAITNTSATVSWVAPTVAPTLGYKYYYSTVNEAPSATDGTVTQSLTADLMGLPDNTTHYLWVKSMCGANDDSVWAGPFSFKTLCSTFSVFPFIENFNADSPTKSCWSVLNANADDDSWDMSYGDGAGNQAAMLYTDYNTGANDDWLISPKLTLTGNERIKFKVRVQSANEPNDFMLKLSTTGKEPADFTTVLMPLTVVNSVTYITVTASLTAYTGDVFIAFHVPPAGLDGWRIIIDDVEVEATPTTAPACIEDMNVVANEGCGNFPTTFSWSSVPSTDGYKISIGTSISTNGEEVTDLLAGFDNKDLGSVLSYSFVGNPNTTYYYVVKPYAGDLLATGCFIDNFTTYGDGCYCTAVPTSVDGQGITNVTIGDTGFPVTNVTNADFTENGAVNITQGVNTVMNITFATGYRYYTTIWIDYNDNYTFETSEIVFSGQAPSTVIPTIAETSFMVPLTANLGQHRMRSISTYSNITPPNPCYSSFDGVALDYLVNVLPAPACLPPTASTVSAIMATSATVNWVSEGTTFNFELDFAGFTQGTGEVTYAIAGNTFDLTNLDPQQDYAYYLQTVCGTESLSPWTGPFLFRTACASFGDFTQDFTTEATIPAPECWKTLVITTTSSPSVSNNSFNDYMSLSNSGDLGAELYLITPSLTDLPLDTHRIKFKASSFTVGATVIVGTMTDPANASTFTAVQTIPVTNAFANYSVTFMNSTTDMYVAFKFVGTALYQTMRIDDVVWETAPTCPDVNVVIFEGATPYTADISWTPGGAETAWEYAYGLETETDPSALTAMPVAGPDSETTITGLQPSTTYRVWVRAACGTEGVGLYSEFITFTTACIPVTEFPWTESFEGITPGFEVFPDCWSEENGDYSTASGGDYNSPRSGVNYLTNSWFASNEYMWTPGFELTAGVSYDFSFYMQGDGFTGWDVDVFQNTVQNSTNATQLGTTTTASGTGDYVMQPYALVSNTIVPTTSGTYYFAVRVNQPSSAPWYIAFDDFRMEPTPTCAAPLAPTATDVTITTATMNWVATTPAPANGYDYYFSSSAVSPNAATVPTGTVAAGVTTANLIDLVGSTIYKIYVRSICGTDDYSSWSYAGTFTTSCINAVLPYTIDFENATIPNMPICTNEENVGVGSDWVTANAPGYGFTSKVLYYGYDFTSPANAWFYSNTVTLVAGTQYSVSYEYGNNFASYTEKLRVSYGATANAAAMTTEIANHEEINQESLQSNTAVFTPTVSGDYVIGFNAYSDANQYDLYLDNIVIQEALGSINFDNNSFTAYPNPVKDMLNVSFTQNISTVTVYNLLGQKVLSMNMNANKGQVDMSSLATGTYLVKVNTENGVKTIKVIKE